MVNNDIVPKTIHELLDYSSKKYAKKPFIWTKLSGKWQAKTFQEFTQDSRALAAVFLKKGYQDKRIALLGGNSYEWMVADAAIMGYVGTAVNANGDWHDGEVKTLLDFVDATVVIYSSDKKNKITSLKKVLPGIEYICFDDIPKLITEFIEGHTMKQLYKLIRKHVIPSKRMSKMVFTSGTTGLPKAVPLTYRNIRATIDGANDTRLLRNKDVHYLFLPLYHIYANVMIFMLSLFEGCEVYLCSDRLKLSDELKEVKPSILFGVPLIYERVYKKIDSKKVREIRILTKFTNLLLKCHIDIRKKVFAKLHNALGGNIRQCFCGGATLDPSIKKFFLDVGIPILEAYGMTETASLITAERRNEIEAGCVGRPIKGMSMYVMSINEENQGEIAVKGPTVTSGYYKNNAANQASFTEDGYFLTGDIGYIKNDKVYLTGRKKRLIVLSNGKKISPDELEALIIERIEVVQKAKVFMLNSRLAVKLFVPAEMLNKNFNKDIKEINKIQPKYKQIEQIQVGDIATQIK